MPTILLDRHDAIATLTLNRPDVLNALDLTMAGELGAALDELANDAAVRCVILRGEGRGFMAGGDVASMHAALPDPSGMVDDLIGTYHEAVLAMAALPKPVIASIHGPVAGAGVGLALNADFALAAQSAKFTMAYVMLGTNPDGGSTYLLPRVVGRRRALEMALLSEPVDATRACELGMVNRVVPDDQLAVETWKLAERLAAGPTAAYARTKALIYRSFEAESMADQLAAEQRAFVAGARGPDFAEGVTAFVEKRKPHFKGR